jgi:hypothetical protein
MEIDYHKKYIKYRTKYLQLKEELEGGGKLGDFMRWIGLRKKSPPPPQAAKLPPPPPPQEAKPTQAAKQPPPPPPPQAAKPVLRLQSSESLYSSGSSGSSGSVGSAGSAGSAVSIGLARSISSQQQAQQQERIASPPPATLQRPSPVDKTLMKPIFLSYGSFGCVSSPIPCDPPCDGPICANSISKLMSQTHANIEMQIYDLIKLDRIESSDKFYIKPQHRCIPKIPLPPIFNEQCPIIHNIKSDTPTVIMYENGGIDLLDYYLQVKERSIITYKKNIIYILEKLVNIFEGVQKLNDNGIYHCDIKMENIVTGLNKIVDLSKLPTDNNFRLIDFGMAQHLDTFKKKGILNNKELSDLNFARPLEFILLADNTLKTTLSTIINYNSKPNKKTNEKTNLDFIIDFYKEYYSGLINYEYKNKLETNFNSNKNELLETILKSTDIYSLGFLLIYFAYFIEIRDIEYKIIKDKIYKFVLDNNLVHPHYDKRFTGKNIVDLYKNLVYSIRGSESIA